MTPYVEVLLHKTYRDNFEDELAWLMGRGFLIDLGILQPEGKGTIAIQVRKKNGLRGVDITWVFHPDDLDIALLFKLTWGGK